MVTSTSSVSVLWGKEIRGRTSKLRGLETGTLGGTDTGAAERVLKWGWRAERERVNSRKLGGSGACSPGKFVKIEVTIMNQVAQKWGTKAALGILYTAAISGHQNKAVFQIRVKIIMGCGVHSPTPGQPILWREPPRTLGASSSEPRIRGGLLPPSSDVRSALNKITSCLSLQMESAP